MARGCHRGEAARRLRNQAGGFARLIVRSRLRCVRGRLLAARRRRRALGHGRRRGTRDDDRRALRVCGQILVQHVPAQALPGDVAGELHLPVAAQVVSQQPRDQQGIGGRPRLGHVAQEPELDGQGAPFDGLLDVGGHAGRVRFQHGACFGAGRRQAGGRGLLQAQRAEEAVPIQRRLAHHLREAAGGPAPVHVHLPQPVLRGDVALGKEEVVQVGGFDVGDAPVVPVDPHLAAEPGQVHGALALGRRAAQVPVAPADDGHPSGEHEGQQHHQEDQERPPPAAAGTEGGCGTPAHNDRLPPTGWRSKHGRATG